jgi:MFS family permease
LIILLSVRGIHVHRLIMTKEGQGSWAGLPHKSQLIVLAMCRFAEPLSNTSALSYLFYMLQSFDPSVTSAEISRQAGFLMTSFALGQFMTGTLWGTVSDRIGRKKVLLIGLSGTVLGTILFGFAHKLWVVIFARTACGLVNGNVGVLRTMISEIVVEKKHQSRAFLIMPMCFNVGSVVGPIIGGLLANPASRDAALGWLLGPDSKLGGTSGVAWLVKFPYALPNVISAIFLTTSLLLCWLFLEETLPECANQPDYGLMTGRALVRFIRRSLGQSKAKQMDYAALDSENPDSYQTTTEDLDITRRGPRISRASEDTLLDEERTSSEAAKSFPLDVNPGIAMKHVAGPETLANSVSTVIEPKATKMKYSQILTTNVVLTLISFMMCPLHVATFMQLWPIYLSTPTSDGPVHLPFIFGGGLGLSTSHVGYAMSVMGVLGVVLQILVFPRVQASLGTMTCYRISLWIFPVAYMILPYLSVLPSDTKDHASGPIFWSALVMLVLIQVVARTFALPSTVILLNNASPNRQCLGTIHGLGSSLSSLSRVIGPLSGAFLFGLGIDIGVVGLVWWVLAAVAMGGAMFSLFIYEGEGLEQEKSPQNEPVVR